MKTIHMNSDSLTFEQIQDIRKFCQKCELDRKHPAVENMEESDWINKPHTLMYILMLTDRFRIGNGLMSFLYNSDDEIIASSGCYKSDFDSNVVIGGCRTYKFQTSGIWFQLANNLMLDHFNWAKEIGAKIFALTFNDYNHKLMSILARADKFNPGGNNSDFYTKMTILPYKALIKNTPQYVLYYKLDQTYEPIWPKVLNTKEDKNMFVRTVILVKSNDVPVMVPPDNIRQVVEEYKAAGFLREREIKSPNHQTIIDRWVWESEEDYQKFKKDPRLLEFFQEVEDYIIKYKIDRKITTELID